MNIGVFTNMLCNGGTERVIAKLSCIWTALHHNVVFFTAASPHENEFPHQCIARELVGVEFYLMDDIKKMQDKYALDIIVVNGGWNNPSIVPLLGWFKELGVKTMVILHHAMNNWAFSGGNAGDFDKNNLFEHLDCLVCVDKIQALWWSRRFSNVFYIPNPVAIAENSSVCERSVRSNALVWVGRASDWGKRVELAIEAFKLIRAKVPDATLSIIGLKPKGKLVELPGLEYVGLVQDTRPYLEMAAVNLVTTLWEVTVPQVVLEAGAVALPTVAMDLPVLKVHGQCGSDGIGGLILAKDVKDMAEKAVSLLKNKDRRLTLGAAAKKDVEKRADLKVVGTRWAGLFNAIVKNRIADYAKEIKGEYETMDVANALIDEIQRSEKFIVETQLPAIQRIRRWKGLLAALKSRLGL